MEHKACNSLPRGRLPKWLRRPIPRAGHSAVVGEMLGELGLASVCVSALCPNKAECFARRTATFMILGTTCTRDCGFCAVPSGTGQPIDPAEPGAVARACERLGIRHAVITSVTRDDLPDGGAGHFAATCLAVADLAHRTAVELLVPDFQGRQADLDTVLSSRPDLLNHNIETVPRLYNTVRPAAGYQRSLALLARAADKTCTKSGLMVGLGETRRELSEVLSDLRSAGCRIITIGQYLAPSARHLPVAKYIEPARFEELAAEARALGFAGVACGPFVRSSYMAQDVLADCSSSPNA